MGPHLVVVAVTGMGARKAREAFSRIVRQADRLGAPISLVVSTGYAGGLEPTLGPGDLVVGDRLLSTDGGEVYASDGEWIERAAGVPGTRRGAIVTAGVLAATRETKAALHEGPDGPIAVDMESATLAAEAIARGLPFLALRVVLDAADEPLRITPGKLLALAASSRLASERLAHGLRILLQGYRPWRHWVPWVFRLLQKVAFGPFTERSWQWPVLYPLRVEGLDTLPPGPIILAFNHQSWMDVVVVWVAFPFRIRMLAKVELFSGPRAIRWLVGTVMDAIPTQRGSDAAIEAGHEALRNGDAVGIYPEGTIPGEEHVPRSAIDPVTGLLPGKTGAVRLALRAGVPLVPVGISGTGDALPVEAAPHLQRLPIPRRLPLTIRIGAPLDLAGFAGREADPVALREATDRLMRAISALVERPSWAPPAPPSPSASPELGHV